MESGRISTGSGSQATEAVHVSTGSGSQAEAARSTDRSMPHVSTASTPSHGRHLSQQLSMREPQTAHSGGYMQSWRRRLQASTVLGLGGGLLFGMFRGSDPAISTAGLIGLSAGLGMMFSVPLENTIRDRERGKILEKHEASIKDCVQRLETVCGEDPVDPLAEARIREELKTKKERFVSDWADLRARWGS